MATLLRKIAAIGLKLEVLQLAFVAGAIAGMIVEAGFMVAVMTGHSLIWGVK